MWTHKVGASQNCYTGDEWDKTLCPDPATCAKNCALDASSYAGTYGVTTDGTGVSLKFVTKGQYGACQLAGFPAGRRRLMRSAALREQCGLPAVPARWRQLPAVQAAQPRVHL